MDILIIDDDPDVPPVLAGLLASEGHRVRIARNGEEGLELLREGKPDAIVLDVEMPKLTGPEMIRRVSMDDAAMRTIPVVLVSGVLGLPDVAADVGTPYFMAKPYEICDLIALLHDALDTRRAEGP